jgi:hypothetical protein
MLDVTAEGEQGIAAMQAMFEELRSTLAATSHQSTCAADKVEARAWLCERRARSARGCEEGGDEGDRQALRELTDPLGGRL